MKRLKSIYWLVLNRAVAPAVVARHDMPLTSFFFIITSKISSATHNRKVNARPWCFFFSSNEYSKNTACFSALISKISCDDNFQKEHTQFLYFCTDTKKQLFFFVNLYVSSGQSSSTWVLAWSIYWLDWREVETNDETKKKEKRTRAAKLSSSGMH